MTDFLLAAQFWVLYELLSLPLRFAMAPLPMRGDVRRVLSRVAGPMAIIFPIWFLGHHGLRLAPASFAGIAGAALILGLALWRVGGPASLGPGLADILLPSFRSGQWRRELALEAASFALFFSYLAWIRLAPEMTFDQDSHGAEKFMNAMLFWSCWHAESLPPSDYWLAGVPQIYYTFGHFFWVVIGRMGRFPAEVVIALSLARLALMVAESSYVLARAWGLRVPAAAFGALLMAWGGNPEALVSAVTQALQIDRGTFMAPDYPEAWHGPHWKFAGYYIWDSARALNGAITETPAWTAILADFHSHHFALPWVLGFFALLLGGDRWFGLRGGRGAGPPLLAMILGLLACAAALSNLWLLPLIALGTMGVFLWRRPASAAGALYPWMIVGALAAALFGLIGMTSGGIPAPPPDPNAMGDGLRGFFERSPIRILGWMQRSTLPQLLDHWGYQLGLLGAASLALMLESRPTAPQKRLAAAAALLLVLGVFVLRRDTYLILFAATALIGVLALGPAPWLRRRPAVFLGVAAALLGGMEIYYIRDGNPIYVRVNTYFKLSLPLWPVMTLGAWSLALRLWRTPHSAWGLALVRAGLLLLIPAAFALPVLGLPARVLQTREGDAGPRAATLNSFAWLHHRPGYEAEAELLGWIRNNVAPPLTVIEYAYDIPFEDDPAYRNSQAGSYDYFARVASLGGRAIPLGWPHHEFQWRGAAVDPVIRRREALIRKLYNATDSAEVHEAAEELGSTWIVMGKVERDNLGEVRFEKLREIVASTGHLRAEFPRDNPTVFIYERH